MKKINKQLEELFWNNGLKFNYLFDNDKRIITLNLNGWITFNSFKKYIINNTLFTESEKNILLQYGSVCGDIKINKNAVSMWTKRLKYRGVSNVDLSTIKKLYKIVNEELQNIIKQLEKEGSQYFYDLNESRILEYIRKHNIHFDKEGNIVVFTYEI